MKKRYETPAVLVVKVQSERMVSNSLGISSEIVSNTEDIGFVKSYNTSHGNYSVWDDDWN
jgi:hypothetical protein